MAKSCVRLEDIMNKRPGSLTRVPAVERITYHRRPDPLWIDIDAWPKGKLDTLDGTPGNYTKWCLAWCLRLLCKESTSSTVDGFSWLLHSWITYPAPQKTCSQSQNPQPTPADEAINPTRTCGRHSIHFCRLQSTSSKESLSAFSRSRRHQVRTGCYYWTTWPTLNTDSCLHQWNAPLTTYTYWLPIKKYFDCILLGKSKSFIGLIF